MVKDNEAAAAEPLHFTPQPIDPSIPKPWAPSSRWPDPAVRVLDKRFEKYYLYNAPIERLATGQLWAEGPVWFGDGRYLLWSDIPNNRIMRWDEETSAVSVFRKPSNMANGNTRDPQGRLVTCEHETRRITRTEYDGRITVLADSFQNKPLNSPNDVIVKSDRTVWFSDPMSGIRNNYMGRVAASELPTNLYRLDPETRELSVATDEILWPNGLAFSPDESLLYVVSSGPKKAIHVFEVKNGRDLVNGRMFIDCGPKGTPDGIRCDTDGNLWCGWGTSEGLDGVFIFAPDGTAIGQIQLPERCANLCFGGQQRNRLFMASCSSIYALHTNTAGATIGG
jgi:gluconolactonase